MSNAAKVGAFTLVAAVIAGYFLLRIENFNVLDERHEYKVRLADAQGLIIKAPVLLRGVKIGRVVALELTDDHVLATILVAPEFPLRQGTSASVASVGLLGEKELELTPGPRDSPPLPPEGIIVAVATPTLDTVIHQMGRVGEDVKEITASVRSTLQDQRLGVVLRSLSELATQSRSLLAASEPRVEATLLSVQRMADAIEAVAKELGPGAAAPNGVGTGGSGGISAVENVRSAAANLEDVTARLRRGEGTLGSLIMNADAGVALQDTLSSVNQAADALSAGAKALGNIRVDLAVRGDYLADLGRPRGRVDLEVAPPGPWFLRAGAATLPTGLRSERRTSTRAERSDAAPAVALIERAESAGTLGFSLLAGGRLGPVALRAGLLESRAGVGGDLWLWDDRVRLGAEAWDFGLSTWNPRLRFEAALAPVRWGAVYVGWDDPLNGSQQLASLYLGLGLKLELNSR